MGYEGNSGGGGIQTLINTIESVIQIKVKVQKVSRGTIEK